MCIIFYRFAKLVAMVSINFSLAGVWLLIEGDLYIDFGLIPCSAIHNKHERWVYNTSKKTLYNIIIENLAANQNHLILVVIIRTYI